MQGEPAPVGGPIGPEPGCWDGGIDAVGSARLTASSARVVISEFLEALGRRFTYDPWRNTYILFGLAWGLPIPIFSLGLDIYFHDRPLAVSSIVMALRQHPVQLFFFLHPIVFGIVFGAMGTVRRVHQQQVSGLIHRLEDSITGLRRANERRQELDRLKQEFIANVTHELKTPLVAVGGYVEMILEGRLGPLTDRQRDGLGTAERNVDRLLAMINDLLLASRMEEKPEFQMAPIPIWEWVEEAVSVVRPRGSERGLRLIRPARRMEGRLLGERNALHRVLVIVLDNAVKFSPAGGKVYLEEDSPVAGRYRLGIRDEGPGISPTALPHVFERFYQADGSAKRQHGGIGLGLAIARQVVEGHGGTLSAENVPAGGARILIELPAEDLRIPTAVRTASDPAGRPPGPRAG